LSLAEEFISRSFSAEQQNERRTIMASMGQNVSRMGAVVSEEEISDYKKKAKALIDKSIEAMPPSMVLDYGEPNVSNNPRDKYTINGKELSAFTDGILHEYVGILYMAGDQKGAEKLGLEIADQLESIIGFYAASNVEISARGENTKDFYAALAGYFKLSSASNDPELGNPEGVLSKRTTAKIDYFYKTMFPSMFDDLEVLANENGESIRRGSRAGYYAGLLHNLQDYSEGMAIKFGWMKAEAPIQQSMPMNGASLDALMNRQP
jgi:hypothetical protein